MNVPCVTVILSLFSGKLFFQTFRIYMSSDQSNLTISSYNITNDTSYNDDKYGITEPIKEIIEDIFFDVQKGKPSVIKRLERLCKKYPRVPQFKNYLAVSLSHAGNEKRAFEVNEQALKAHPDYLFARTNQAKVLMERGETDAIPKLLGEEMELKALYPDKDRFHILEVLTYFNTTVKYFLMVDDPHNAQIRLDLLREIDASAPETFDAMAGMARYNMEKAGERIKRDKATERSVESRSYNKSVQTDKKPHFNHPETEALYEYGFEISPEQIEDILALPRQSLIQDLEIVLEDTIKRFEFFRNEAEEYGWDDRKYSFSIHAAYMLAELNSEQSLTHILEILRQGDEFLDFWYADSLEPFFTEPVAVLGKNQLDRLSDFVKEPNNSAYARNIATTAVEHVAHFNPEMKPVVINIFREWFEFHLNRLDDDRIIDTQLLSFMVWSCLNLNAEELLKDIRKLYDLNLISISMMGSYADIEKDISKKSFQSNEPSGIFKMYKEFDWSTDMPAEPDTNYNLFNNPSLHKNTAPIAEDDPWSDVGRNDPCPCGSGKKYKKCCLRS